MTSDAKIKANRANARASTGPKTTQGRVRAARNAYRHGLSLPLYGDPILSEEVEALVCEIAGADAKIKMRQHARNLAEAVIDLRRVRHARHQFLSDKLNEEYYESRAKRREKIALIFELLRPNGPDIPDWFWTAMNDARCRGARLLFVNSTPRVGKPPHNRPEEILAGRKYEADGRSLQAR